MIRTGRRSLTSFGIAASLVVASIPTAVLALAPTTGLAQSAPATKRGTSPPETGAASWALVDSGSGRYLAGESPDERRAPAATASVMTALIALEEAEDLDAEVTVPEEAERYVGFTYSNVGLIAGERLSVLELLEAAMISSGTDATYALAHYLGYGDPESFVDQMNAEARELGLENTRFTNPTGQDEEGNYSTARDLAVIAREARQDPRFAEIVSTPETTISTRNREIDLFNTNELLYSYPAADGIRTGSSPQAGSSMIASAESDGASYIAVVLGAGSVREAADDARAVLQYGFESYDSRPLVQEGEEFARLPLPYKKGQRAPLVAGEKVEALVGPGSEVEHRVTSRPAPDGVPAGERLGSVAVLVDGAKVGESPLVTAEGHPRASIWDKARLAALWPIKHLAAALNRYAAG